MENVPDKFEFLNDDPNVGDKQKQIIVTKQVETKEQFSIYQLEEEIKKIDDEKIRLDKIKADLQGKIDNAKTSLNIK